MSASRDLDAAFALLPVDEPAARKAFTRLHEAPDDATQRLACAGMLLAIASEFADFRGLLSWLSSFRADSRAEWPAASRPEDGARLDAALLAVPMLDDSIATGDPVVATAADRLTEALGGALSVTADERMLLWKCLVDYRTQRMDPVAFTRIAAQAQDFIRTGGVSPTWQARWWLLTARHHEFFAAADATADALARAQRLADTHGLASVRYELLCVEMTGALKVEAWARAEVIAREIELAMPDVRAGRLPAGLRAQAWRLLWLGEPGAALLHLDRLLAICHDVEVPRRDRGAYHVLRAYTLLALDRFDEALAGLRAQREHQRGDQRALLDALIELSAGLGDVHAGLSDGVRRVCDAIALCATRDFGRFLLPLPGLAAQASEIALDAGVEPEFVARVVRQRKLVPSDRARADWPWRLQVRVLGAMEVLRDGKPLPFSTKRPKKPLELLALLATQGRKPLPAASAIDALWPSLDAEAPKASLEVALVRLRKLLDVPGVILSVDGGLRLDLRTTWTDVAAFEVLEERWEADGDAGTPQAMADARRAIALYRGALRASDTLTPPWRLLRDQHARRFSRLVIGTGTALEAQGRWREAADVYEQGVARDLLAEPIYRALMRVQIQLGERAEALRTFARCRDLLALALGVAPAPETWSLRELAMEPA